MSVIYLILRMLENTLIKSFTILLLTFQLLLCEVNAQDLNKIKKKISTMKDVIEELKTDDTVLFYQNNLNSASTPPYFIISIPSKPETLSKVNWVRNDVNSSFCLAFQSTVLVLKINDDTLNFDTIFYNSNDDHIYHRSISLVPYVSKFSFHMYEVNTGKSVLLKKDPIFRPSTDNIFFTSNNSYFEVKPVINGLYCVVYNSANGTKKNSQFVLPKLGLKSLQEPSAGILNGKFVFHEILYKYTNTAFSYLGIIDTTGITRYHQFSGRGKLFYDEHYVIHEKSNLDCYVRYKLIDSLLVKIDSFNTNGYSIYAIENRGIYSYMVLKRNLFDSLNHTIDSLNFCLALFDGRTLIIKPLSKRRNFEQQPEFLKLQDSSVYLSYQSNSTTSLFFYKNNIPTHILRTISRNSINSQSLFMHLPLNVFDKSSNIKKPVKQVLNEDMSHYLRWSNKERGLSRDSNALNILPVRITGIHDEDILLFVSFVLIDGKNWIIRTGEMEFEYNESSGVLILRKEEKLKTKIGGIKTALESCVDFYITNSAYLN